MGAKSRNIRAEWFVGFLCLLVQPSSHLQAQRAVSSAGNPGAAKQVHRVAVIDGDVKSGQAFERVIGNGLKVLLEPIASGWVLRVVPVAGPRGAHDYAELATPPYQSVSPLLISTDFSFRAQDALGWNPRNFRFAADRSSFDELSRVYDEYQRLAQAGPNAAPQMRATESRLALLVSYAPEAKLLILDAHLVQGTGDQTRAASLVAVHANSSARQVDQPADGVATPLGRLTWLRFRIRIDLPRTFRTAPGTHVERAGAL